MRENMQDLQSLFSGEILERGWNIQTLNKADKGYVLVFDAVLALILFMGVLSAVDSIRVIENTSLGQLNAQQQLNDTLDLLGQGQLIQLGDMTSVSRAIDQLLPPDASWRFSITQSELQNGAFVEVSMAQLGNVGGPGNKDSVSGERTLVTVSSGRIQRYWLVRLEAWNI